MLIDDFKRRFDFLQRMTGFAPLSWRMEWGL